MIRLTRLVICLLLLPRLAGAALNATTIWEMNASGTANMVNGGGFDPSATFAITNFAATSATGNSPVISTATYNFVTGDAGAWVYISAGTNWIPGWYKISSVDTGAHTATVNATVGAAVWVPTNASCTASTAPWPCCTGSTTGTCLGQAMANTVAGVASTASPSSGTGAVDYSQSTAATFNPTDLSSTGSSTTLTSTTGAGFTAAQVGNIIHITTTGTGAHCVVGWYRIATFTDTQNVVLDRTSNDGTAGAACTGFVGGALNFGALEDAFFEAIIGGNTVWIKAGTYTVSATISVSSTSSTGTSPSNMIGYNALRGDAPVKANQPLIQAQGQAVTFGQFQNFWYTSFTTSATSGISQGSTAVYGYDSFVNTATATNKAGITQGANGLILFSEAVSQNGVGIVTGSGTIYGCYVHDSTTGISLQSTATHVINTIVEGCLTNALLATVNGTHVVGSTLYGREGKQGTGINFAATTGGQFYNNIIYGFTTGISASSALKSDVGDFNDYFNNTTDVSNISKGLHDLALDPQFVSTSQITFATATTSGSVLTQSGADFSTVTDNVDFVHVTGGTGVTQGGYLITNHTGTTLTTNNALGTSNAGNVTGWVGTNHDFAIGANLKGAGFPGLFNNSETTSSLDIGAVQRTEATPVPTCAP